MNEQLNLLQVEQKYLQELFSRNQMLIELIAKNESLQKQIDALREVNQNQKQDERKDSDGKSSTENW